MQVAVVTGGTQGIGFEVAKALAMAGTRVLLLSRKEDNGQTATQKIKEEEGSVDVEFVPCDLGHLKTVRSVADRLRESESRLDFESVMWFSLILDRL